MARRPAGLPEGSRISDYISLGVIAKTFPADRIEAVLAATGKASVHIPKENDQRSDVKKISIPT